VGIKCIDSVWSDIQKCLKALRVVCQEETKENAPIVGHLQGFQTDATTTEKDKIGWRPLFLTGGLFLGDHHKSDVEAERIGDLNVGD